MENKSIQPGTAPAYIIEKGEQVPAEYVVTADGQVVAAPAGGLRRREQRSGVDADGREKRFMFIRRLNSTGIAMLLDVLLGNVAAFQIIFILLIVWILNGTLTLNGIIEGFTGEDTSGVMQKYGFASILANCIALPVAHIAAGYMHSVRNKFSLAPALRWGKGMGWQLPGAAVVALGCTYAWVFAYMICGWLMPGSFFGRTGFGGNSFAALDTGGIIVSVIYTCILAPLTEEFLFRGVMLRSLSKYGTGFAVVLSSFLFGLIHGNIYQTPFAIMTGIVLAYTAVRSGSIWPGVIVHFVVNAFATARELLALYVPERWEQAVHFGFFGFAGLMILASVIILCVCRRNISWKPVDEERTILLPRVDSKARLKPAYVLLSAGLMAIILMYTLLILFSCGVTFGLENLLG